MASNARNFSRSVIAVAATCILSAAVAIPAIASESVNQSEPSVAGVTVGAVAEGQLELTTFVQLMQLENVAAPAVVPEEPGQVLPETGSEIEPDPNEGEQPSADADADGSADGSTAGADADGGADGSAADADMDGGADGVDGEVSDDGDSSGTVSDDGDVLETPIETEAPIQPPTTNPGPELPIEPVQPQPENPGMTMVPEEPGQRESTEAPVGDDSQPTLNTSVEPEDDASAEPTKDTADAKTEVLVQTGANELLIVLGIGALLVVGGLVMVLMRLRKRGG